MPESRTPVEGAVRLLALRAGLVAGSLAAVVASLVQLPLRSPSDVLFNSGSVTAGSLAVGAIAGMMWRWSGRRGSRTWQVWAGWTAVSAVVCLLALLGEALLDRTFLFVLPLAAIVFALTGALTPLFARRPELNNTWLVVLIAAIAVGVGAGLAMMGDAPNGRLELPARGS
jgi:hypothetical protein